MELNFDLMVKSFPLLLAGAGRVVVGGDEGVGAVEGREGASVVLLVELDDGLDAVGLHLVHEPVHGLAGLLVDEPPLVLVKTEAVGGEDGLEERLDGLAGVVDAELAGESRVERGVRSAAGDGRGALGDQDHVGALLGEQLADERRRDDRAGVEHLQVLQVAELGAIR